MNSTTIGHSLDMRLTMFSTSSAVATSIPQWLQIHQRCTSATPFNHPIWVMNWWRKRCDQGLRWSCIAAHDRAGELIGLLPLVHYPDGVTRFAGHDLHDVASAVVADKRRGEFWQHAIDLLRQVGQSPVVELPTVSDADLAALRTVSGARLLVSGTDPGARINLPPTWTEHHASLSASRRKRMRAERRTLERDHGPVRFTITDSGPDLIREVGELWALREHSWHARDRYEELPDHARGPVLRDFLTGLASRSSSTRLVAVGTLAAAGQPVSSALLLRSGRRTWYWMCAFAADRDKYGPGRQLLAECTREAINMGLTCLELGRGVEEYKFTLGASRYELMNVHLVLR